MGNLVAQYAPNRIISHAATSSAAWRVVASDGTLHASLAAVIAAGKSLWPNMGPTPLQALKIRSENASGADGSPFYYVLNKTAVSDDDEGDLVSGSGQADIQAPGIVWNIWVRKTTAGDELILKGMY